MPSAPRRVAVVGDGPAGCTLAALLARAGVAVALFAPRRRPPLVVGESLVPAVVPLLRELGVEEQVADFSVLKPGATFTVEPGRRIEIDFAEAGGRVPGYAFNTPRERFDAALLDAAERSGAALLRRAARLERDDAPDAIRLDAESRDVAAQALGGEPDFVVDAGGRARHAARLLGLPTAEGSRRDIALFAHLEGVPLDNAGHVHSDRLSRGWCWRIPLPGRVSLGVVVPQEVLRSLGPTAEAQYEAMLQAEPWLQKLTADARRVSPVARYSNYQLVTQRAVGPGWALAGDALGFIDPVFSSGAFIAMDGARLLARTLVGGAGERALRRYQRDQIAHLEAWRQAVDSFYDGRFFAIFQLRANSSKTRLGRFLDPRLGPRIASVFTGEGTRSRINRLAVDWTARAALRDPDTQLIPVL